MTFGTVSAQSQRFVYVIRAATMEPGDIPDLSPASEKDFLGKRHSGHVLKYVHHGPYDTLKDTCAAMEAHITKDNLRAMGSAWALYVTDPVEMPMSDHVTEVYMLPG